MKTRPVAPKEYYSIGEVCELVGLKPHVLRYWETQFRLLSPNKNRAGNRVYRRKEIKLVLLVKELLHKEKYTIDGARRKLEELRGAGELRMRTGRALDRDVLDHLRADLDELESLLTLEADR